MVNTYDEFAALENSEKETLAIIEASQRLVGWELHSGVIWKIESFSENTILKINDQGTSFTEVASLGAMASGTYFNDFDNSVIYIQAFDDGDPNSDFIFLTKNLHFSKSGVNAPQDPDDAASEPIHWTAHILSTSEFGVELDNENQLGFAIEGSGTLNLVNDQDFWPQNYTKLFFENHKVRVWSWNRGLPITEAKLLFRGRVQRKNYSRERITFRVNDLLSELRGQIQLTTLQNVAGARIPESLNDAFARRIYGRKFGFRPTNIDQVLDSGYPLTGTLTFTNGSDTVTGVGTQFLKELSPDDEITIIADDGETVIVSSIQSDGSLTLSEVFPFGTQSGTYEVIPNIPKKYTNRVWKLAGHALRQPETTVVNASSLSLVELGSTLDIEPDDDLFFGDPGTGELVPVQRVSRSYVKLAENLIFSPSVGTSVTRPAVQNLRINNTKLRYDRDYTVDAVNGTLTLDEAAEFNVAPIRDLNGTLTFTSSSRTVTGTATNFKTTLQPGYWIRPKGVGDFFEVGSIIDDTTLELRTASTVSETNDGQYKAVEYFDTGSDVLTCDVLGITDTGAKDGALIVKGAQIVKHLIEDAGITDLNAASFLESEKLADQDLGLVIPESYNDKKTGTFRSEINKVNVSIFGSLIQNNAFELQYNILSPERQVTVQEFREYDVIDQFQADTSNERMASNIVIEYKSREYKASTGESDSVEFQTAVSDIATYILQTDREKRVQTLLVRQKDALIFSLRWRHILEIGTTILKFKTKLQGMNLQVNDRIEFLHRNFYERVGGGKRKISAIQSIKKSGEAVMIEAEDLSDSFNRNSTITENDADAFVDADIEQKVVNGYITQNNGLTDSDRETFGLYTIW